MAEADSTNQIQRYYIYGAGLLAMVEPNNTLYCYHFDATGHTVALTDINKTIVNKYAYSPFGTIANQEETVVQPFKFVGQYGIMTEENGWYYMRARYYDPALGRFISEDPIGFDGGDVNLYAYVLNNPINMIDPDGLASLWIGGSGIVAAVEEGGNVGKGWAADTSLGTGVYLTKGTSKGIAASAGLEFGLYTGSIKGDTTVTTGGLGPFSFGLVKGDRWWEIGFVFGVAKGAPLEISQSENTTYFVPNDPAPVATYK